MTKQEQRWWIGVPVAAGIVSWLPYWAWNIAGRAEIPSGWWRVPVVTPGLFDTHVYLHWMGAAALGLPYGGHLKWFGSILAAMWRVIGSWASMPELWIASRWITFTLAIWIAAWIFERWAALPRPSARILSAAFFSALILTLGMRPGVYAWYLPFCMLGLLAVNFAAGALDGGFWIRAAAWSAAAAALTWIYPWFFMVACAWLAVAWAKALIRVRPRRFFAACGLAAAAVGFAAVPLARWFLDPARAGLIGMYERNGMAFARVPFFANTVLAIGAWVAFLFALASGVPESPSKRRFLFLLEGWLVLLLLWFHTPITGIHTYSDHFISSVAVLSWISLGSVWAWMSGPDASIEPSRSRLVRWIPAAVAAGASLFFVYVIQQPLRFNFFKFDSYVIHLVHWFALAAAGWLVVWRFRYPSSRFRDRRFGAALLAAAIVIGLFGVVPAWIRDLPKVQASVAKAPVIDWIASNIPSASQMCADPETASFYAAHTGRRVNPAEATLSWPDSSEQVIRNLETIARAYDVNGSGNEEMFRFFTDQYRTIPCASESKYSHNAPYGKMLAVFGFNESRTNDLLGCDKGTIDRNRARLDAAIAGKGGDPEEFRRLCPSVIIPDAQKSFWTLPEGYTEQRITNDLSIWNIH